MEEGRPVVDAERLRLYHRWHHAQGAKRDWPSDMLDAEEYYHQFAFPHPCGRELSYWDDAPLDGGPPKLVGVAITDVTPRALSAVYTYYDPAYERLSLGTASVLFQIHRARRSSRPFVYLGYRVLGCASSEYKARFQPHELLEAGREAASGPRWVTVAGRWADPSPVGPPSG